MFIVGRTTEIAASDFAKASARVISPVHEVEHLLRLEWTLPMPPRSRSTRRGPEQSRRSGWGPSTARMRGRKNWNRSCARTGIEGTVRIFPVAAIPRGAAGKVHRALSKSLMLATAGKTR